MRIANEAQPSAIMAKSNIGPVSLLLSQRTSHKNARHSAFLVNRTGGHGRIAARDAQNRPDLRPVRPTFAQRGLLVRQRLNLAFGQEQGSLSEQEQHAEAIQDYIQHDPSPWRFSPEVKGSGGPGDADECGRPARWTSMGN
jgi:hypothetical protein